MKRTVFGVRSLAFFAAALLALAYLTPAAAAGYGIYASLTEKLATRTGPGTWYDEPGTFFSGSWSYTSVRVLTRAWDSRNDIWWVQVEFTSGGRNYRAYTGLKRVSVNIGSVPDEQTLGTASMLRSSAAWWGPGSDYARSSTDIPAGISVTVLDIENGYAQIEFSDSRVGYSRRRAWTPADNLSGGWSSGGYGGQSGGYGGQSGGYGGYGSSIPAFPTASYTVWLRNYNVDRIRPQCGPGYNYAVFASMNGSTRLYDPRNITYLSAHFCVDNWVYIEFGYTDGVRRCGFFEKSLFDPSVSWSSIPSYSLSAERHGTVTSSVTPYNGPGSDCGSYSSCQLYRGDAVHACMEYNGWYLCRFYNGHGNNYGEIYLWVPGHSISWN